MHEEPVDTPSVPPATALDVVACIVETLSLSVNERLNAAQALEAKARELGADPEFVRLAIATAKQLRNFGK